MVPTDPLKCMWHKMDQDQTLLLSQERTHGHMRTGECTSNPHTHTSAPTMIQLVLRSDGGPQENIFIAVIKEKLAYGPLQANIWLRVRSIMRPPWNM